MYSLGMIVFYMMYNLQYSEMFQQNRHFDFFHPFIQNDKYDENDKNEKLY